VYLSLMILMHFVVGAYDVPGHSQAFFTGRGEFILLLLMVRNVRFVHFVLAPHPRITEIFQLIDMLRKLHIL